MERGICTMRRRAGGGGGVDANLPGVGSARASLVGGDRTDARAATNQADPSPAPLCVCWAGGGRRAVGLRGAGGPLYHRARRARGSGVRDRPEGHVARPGALSRAVAACDRPASSPAAASARRMPRELTMLFNSYAFVLGFLPLSVLLFHGLGGAGFARSSIGLLTLLSLGFYGWWNPIYLLLIVPLIVANFALAAAIVPREGRRPRAARPLLVFGVVLNLATLGYFKYANFFLDNLNAVRSEGQTA